MRLNEMGQHLIKLKYPILLINNAIEKAKSFNSNNNNTLEFQQNTNYINYISTYDINSIKFFNNAISPRLNLYYSNFMNFTQNNSTKLNIQKCYRQPPNLLYSLKNNIKFKVYKCNKPKCKLCQDLITYYDQIQINGIFLHINKSCNCQTKNVVYYLKCKGHNCTEDYIGYI